MIRRDSRTCSRPAKSRIEAASWFLWSIRGEELSAKQIRKVVQFWDKCVTWAESLPAPPSALMSSLGALAWSLEDAAGRHRELLVAAAPHLGVHHSTHEFLGELLRLVKVSPADVSVVLGKVLEGSEPFYDYQDRLKSLVGELAERGQRPAALEYCNRLWNVSGMPELFAKLTAAG